jgi:hypothetical protein
MASWGLIAKGEESIPYLLAMMRSTSPESREDAAGALGWLGRSDSGLVERLTSALGSETSDQARDSIVVALGELRSKDAIPALALVIRDEQADGDTRWTAMQSLGQIVRRRFDRNADPMGVALAWLTSHKY